jgi:hypothetical protein
MKKPFRPANCPGCRSFDQVPHAPMLRDAAWAELAAKDENLCADCMFDRASKRRIPLTLADLTPCPSNLFHRPMSWFDLFASGEPAAVVAAWLKAAQGAADTRRDRAADLGISPAASATAHCAPPRARCMC